MIDKPGVYDIDAATYHADKLMAVPTLSSSVLKLLVDRSPLHAWAAHPRLNPDFKKDDDKKFDFGNALHAGLLGGARIAVIQAADYRTKAAQDQRDSALARGSVPVLPHQMSRVQAACAAVFRQLKTHEAKDALTAGKPEQTILWFDEEFKIWVRIKLDWLPNSPGTFYYDAKSSGDANPIIWTRRLFDLGADIQAVLYSRGIKAVLKIDRPIFRFIVIEADAPHAMSVVQLSPSALDLATRKVSEGMALWAKCLTTDRWPGYPGFVFHVDSPPWKAQQFEDRQQVNARAEEFKDSLTILGGG